jgi:hypothetical protein
MPLRLLIGRLQGLHPWSRLMKKRIICIICVILYAFGFTAKAAGTAFADVPAGDWSEEAIAKAADLGIMGGYGSGIFGYGDTITRAEFTVMLPRLFHWSLVNPVTPTFKDNTDINSWYYKEIETAVANGAVDTGSSLFRPSDPITREEMAVMLVRALGYSALADSLKNVKTPFTDVTSNLTYIAMAYDFGIINGTTPTTFNPGSSATREQAAVMMTRLYDRFFSKIGWAHAFYAISSYVQKDMIPAFNAVSFGWSKLEIDGTGAPVLNTSSSNGNTASIPSGYQEVVQLAKKSGVPDNLNVYLSASKTINLSDGTITDPCSVILNNAENRTQAIAQITAELQHEKNYSGVTIDFEEMRGTQLKNNFNIFLQELRAITSQLGMTVYVCVPPVTSDGIYYDGYDYKTIGDYADKVILMAHDYEAKSLTTADMDAGFTMTPTSPIYEIYTALQAITDSTAGVQDKSKIALAISFGSVQWKLRDGKVLNTDALLPEPLSIYNRMLDPSSVINYSVKFQNPYITYHNSIDDTDNIIWYEDTRSVEAKMDLARMFGITGISFWRLGIIPAYGDSADRQLLYDVPTWLQSQK